jgi:hypothetical protein
MREEFQKDGSNDRRLNAFSAVRVAEMPLATYVIAIAIGLTACSKSPPEAVATAAEAAGKQLMQPLVQKDASAQARRMTEMVLSDKPECAVFRDQMKEAGKGSPYEGATQWKLVHTQQDACAAGCCK